MQKPEFTSAEKAEKREWGSNVLIQLKFIRHGDRTPDKFLSDFGREQATTKATESGIDVNDFDAVKALGSSMGPDAEVEVDGKTIAMGRALETAHIFAGEIDEEQEFVSRVNDLLNFATVKMPAPYEHVPTYNANLPDNYEELSPKEKASAGEIAQVATVNYAFATEGPEAEAWKKETAGAFAFLVEHYKKMSEKLKSNSRVLLPAGSHSPNMEMLLQQALVFTDDQGHQQIGFDNVDDIGGPFQPADTYNIFIATDEQGNFKELIVTFNEPHRPQGELRLDEEKVKELAEFYEELHPIDKYER
ncbi:hypothetical protein K8R42_01635 [bacterium]|nr:hypothetical protein [bacterium]